MSTKLEVKRGNAWTLIAENLNSTEHGFKVSIRSVREKFGKLYEEWLKKESDEEKASGIEGTDEDEFEMAMRDVHERMEEVKEEWNKESEKVAQEKQKAIDMRKTATERIGQTKKRKVMEDESEDEENEGKSGKDDKSTRRKRVDFGQVLSKSLEMKLQGRREEKQQDQVFQQSLLQQQNMFLGQQQQQMMEFMKANFGQQQQLQQMQQFQMMEMVKLLKK